MIQKNYYKSAPTVINRYSFNQMILWSDCLWTNPISLVSLQGVLSLKWVAKNHGKGWNVNTPQKAFSCNCCDLEVWPNCEWCPGTYSGSPWCVGKFCKHVCNGWMANKVYDDLFALFKSQSKNCLILFKAIFKHPNNSCCTMQKQNTLSAP